MSNSAIIQTGTSFHLYDESVQPHDKLPAGIYRIQFSKTGGYWLSKLDEDDHFTNLEQKLYGNHNAKIDKIFNRYTNTHSGLGVLFSGDKGMGKSLAVMTLAKRAIEELDLPVILVNNAYPNVAEYISSIDEAVVIFDEFEKVFQQEDADLENQQNQFLNLLDGFATTKRLYLFTVNDTKLVSDYLLNRPGRIHYHIKFRYPEADAVREYLLDNTTSVDKQEIEKAVAFSATHKINYDHLRAIAQELNTGDTFTDIIEDLNIDPDDTQSLAVDVTYDNGVTEREYTTGVRLHNQYDQELRLYPKQFDRAYDVKFNPKDGVFTDSGLVVKPFDIQVAYDTEDTKANRPKPVKLKFSVALPAQTKLFL